MTQFSLANLFGITIRESANDGSDFTNPDADYRRLFLGEDGQLHVKDSAGTVTDIGGSVTEITDLPTADTTTTNVLAPDGAGGVAWRAEAGGGVDSGTSFPGSPSAGDLFWRTDLGLMAYYDGTRWLGPKMSMGIAQTDFANPQTTAPKTPSRWTWNHDYNLWVVAAHVQTYVLTTNSGSHYWTVTVAKSAANNTPTTLASANTSADTASTWTTHKIAIGAVVTAAEAPGGVLASTSVTGSPGNLYLETVLECHLILT